MRCSVARLCERTVGRRVPLLRAGGGLLHTTPHCVVVTAELVRSRGALRPALNGGGFHRVRSCGVTESRTVLCGGGWRGRSLSVVGNGRSRELCEALKAFLTSLSQHPTLFFNPEFLAATEFQYRSMETSLVKIHVNDR